MGRLEGQRIVVTGAAAGIGRAVVRRFLAEGAQVVAVVRRDADAIALMAEGARTIVGDVSDYHTAERAVLESCSEFGGLDCYIANAGVWDFHKRLDRQSPEELRCAFEEIFGVNFLAALYGARAALESLRASRGSLLVTGSNASFLAGGGGVLYTASKFALRGLVLQLAKEFAPDVRVNGIAPGATNTGISGPAALGQRERAMNTDEERMTAMRSHMLLGRVSEPEEHVGLYLTLAARNEAPYVTGAMLASDGGLTISV